MVRNDLKIAAYLDEAGEEPQSGCETLISEEIYYFVLRQVWANNICDISDNGHQKLKAVLQNFKLTPICIASELGKVDSTQLSRIDDAQIQKTINIATYYNTPYLRVFAGIGSDQTPVEAWLSRVAKLCADNNITPLLEITEESPIFDVSSVAICLSKHPTWKLLYDPVQLILKRNHDPFIKYWTLLKSKTAAIDVRDYKIGKGFKPPGMGDARITKTVHDAIDSDYKGWFFLEPALGRRHGDSNTKSDTFRFGVHAFDNILNEKLK